MAFWLKDNERSVFGLGWEYKRREKSLEDNPFVEGTKEYSKFIEGYNAFTPSKKSLYDKD